MDASDGYAQPVPRPPRQRGAAGKGVFHKASRILEERAAKEKLLFDALEPGAKLEAYRAARQAEAAAALQELGPASGEPAASEVSRRTPAVLAPLSTAQRGGAASRPQASFARKASGSGYGISSGIVAAYGRPEQPQPQPPPPQQQQQQQQQQPSQQQQQQPQQPQSQPRPGGRNERVIRADSQRRSGVAGGKLKTVGHYVMQETIGEGTFGKVKRGVHSLTGETVAIKILEKSKIKTEADLRRVTREIKILKQAQHPNCIRLLEVIDTPQQIFLMTEFLNGGELFDYIVHKSRLPEPEAAGVFLQVLNGVEYLHTIKVIHRDLKPENLLMQRARKDSAGFTVKVADFGLSNTCEGDCLLATACGSPCYAAPEMIAGKKYDGTKSDVWSLGVVLFALVCGFLPFEDQDTPTLYRKILNAKYDCPAFISGEARDLIKRILDTDPSTRPSVAQLRAHPWLLRHAAPEQAAATSCAAQTPASTALDPCVLALLEPLGISAEAVAKGHSEGLHNNATVSYYLFSERIRRVEHESGRPLVLPDAQVPKALVQTQQRKKPTAASATPREQDPATATAPMMPATAAATAASKLATPTGAEQATPTASEPTPATAREPVPAAAAAAVAPAPHVAPQARPVAATEPEPELDGPAAVAVDAGGSARSAAKEAASTPSAASTERIAQPPSPLDGAGDIASDCGQQQHPQQHPQQQQHQQQQQQLLLQQQQHQQQQQHEQHELQQPDQEEQHQQQQQEQQQPQPQSSGEPEDDASRASSAAGARTGQSLKSEAKEQQEEETKDGEAGKAGPKAEAQLRAPIPTRPALAPFASRSIPARPERTRAAS
jgi:hypothetical protein